MTENGNEKLERNEIVWMANVGETGGGKELQQELKKMERNQDLQLPRKERRRLGAEVDEEEREEDGEREEEKTELIENHVA